ncbi:hypothetical protein ACQP2T_03115 [Nonomuraea sp. CA-143628]|uniref:hypothetical protein n=1 Tax=Nonomuraea sp. CA-143628 TaxID=3239997 RepID=UPI003D9246B0
MDQPEYETPTPIAGFEIWRENDRTWRGRHTDSGREISAERWELLVWRARETVMFVAIASVNDLLKRVTQDTGESK